MCLITNNYIPYTAEHDITCYKIYVYVNGKYVSPYQNCDMPGINELVTTELQRSGDFYIEKGFHSFVNSIDAKLYSYKGRDSIVVSCIIPKGAKYYKGFFENCESYCSDSIILKEEICV